MHRFHLPPEEMTGSVLTLRGREAHHGLRVLRLRRGETVATLDGAGTACRCEVSELARDSIALKVQERSVTERPPYQVTLVQAIPKGKLFDSIIQKGTELGVHRIIPLLSERVITQLDDEKAEGKVEHWRATAIEAIKQSGSAWLPQIENPIAPRTLLARCDKHDLPLIASLQSGSCHPRGWFREFEHVNGRRPATACVWVGPEGDFSQEETSMIIEAAARPVTLGNQVLRCETAAIYCLSVLNYEFQSTVS